MNYTKKTSDKEFPRRSFYGEQYYLLLPSVSDVPAVMRCAYKIGNAVMRTTSMEVTFVMGRLRGLSIWLKIQIGRVC